jgi:phosphoserine aminotransferase
MYNTPPVFAIYVMMLTLQWLDNFGGTDAIEVRNNAKAALLYNEIERNGLFKAVVPNPQHRSTMNPTFVLNDAGLENEFLALAQSANISGIKGHRSVGGFRASMYNAMDIDSVQALVDIMQHFEATKG